jgi:glycogen synthase
MRICARDLAVGDILQVNDWQLHIVRVECENAVAVVTAEFAFVIHFGQHEFVTVHARAEAV